VCLGVRGIEPQAVLLGLDQAGIAVHSGAPAPSEDLAPSPVLEAMGVDAHHSLRISVGWSTTDDDVDALLHSLPDVLTTFAPSPAEQPTRPAGPTPAEPQRSCRETCTPWSPART
jgi:cysteine sulfinate desulfinase/cysteine desulfurase-like protein